MTDSPPQVVFEVRQFDFVVAEDGRLPGKADTERHLQEKERLLKRMDRKHGKWNDHHPRRRLLEALRGFSSYAETQQAELNRLKSLYIHASKKQRALLEREVRYSKKFDDIAALLQRNQQVCDGIVRNAMDFYGVSQRELDDHVREMEAAGRPAERVSVSQALKHFVRDWAAAGARERDAAFPCILHALRELFPRRGHGKDVRILLPGAGLGRLGHEVAKLGGFEVTNNEWSMYQNVAYRYLEQQLPQQGANATTIHPFLDSWSHHRSTADMLRPVSFPDAAVDAGSVVLVEGDFTTVFRDSDGPHAAGSFDALVTHFFIDTARNLMNYFDTIARLLRPGGYWVNFGPLLYGTGPYVQLALDEIVAVAEAMGFEFLDVPARDDDDDDDNGCRSTVTLPGKKVRGIEAVYGFDERALTKNAYDAQFWVARKRL